MHNIMYDYPFLDRCFLIIGFFSESSSNALSSLSRGCLPDHDKYLYFRGPSFRYLF